MANNNRCGGCGRRNSNNGYGCLSRVGGRYGCWDNYPYYGGPCPDKDGMYDRCEGIPEVHARDGRFGMFTAMLPMAVAANGVLPLVSCAGTGCDNGFAVNCGMITVEKAGTYLATYTVRVPEEAAINSTLTLNVNDASQSTAVTQVGGAAPTSFSAQAIFEACDRCTVTLRTAEAINVAESSTQPLVTLSLVKLD